MRIEQLQAGAVKPSEAQPAADKAGAGGGQAPAASQADQADLSRLARVLSGQVERDARLEELRVQVAEGAYQVPAADLGRRLVEALLRGED